MKKIVILLIIISTALMFGCFDYSLETIIYEPWFCTVNTDGTGLHYLRESIGHHFVVTPDSEKVILFSNHHIYSMNIDGSDFITLNDSIGISSIGPSPSVAETPEGTKIALSNNRDIYEIDLESGEITNLTNTPNITEFHPHYSYDGSKIVYSTNKENDSLITISTMDNNGGNKNVVIEYKNPVFDYSSFCFPCFSIDDEKIFYIWSGDSNEIDHGLYSYNIGDSTNHFLFEGSLPFGISMPADGSKIVFYSYYDDNIYTMGEDGSDLTNLGYSDYYKPIISSDVSEILFEYGIRLFIMNSDGSDRRQIIDDLLWDHCKTVSFLSDNKVLCSVERRVQ